MSISAATCMDIYISTAYLQRIYSVSTCQGDLGRVDGDGFYSVVGRIKEIIITAGGENIAPVNIEEEVSTQHGRVVIVM